MPAIPPVLHDRTFRRFFAGQLVSVCGTWMQNVALGWLVLRLTGSGSALGTIAALQALPFALGSPFGGLIADRSDRRRLLLRVQLASAVLAAILAALTWSGVISYWMIGALSVATGAVNALEIPARQAFMLEMVGRGQLRQAIAINNVVANSGRLIGPAVGGALVATVGMTPCFVLNALSFAAVLLALSRIRPGDLAPATPLARAGGQLREGFAYAWRTITIRRPLLAVALVGATAWQFPVSLPLLARFTFHAGAAAYGAMAASLAVGAILGGAHVASHRSAEVPRLRPPTLLFGIAVLATALAPSVAAACALLVITGILSVEFSATASTRIQLGSEPVMHGRVTSLYALGFTGTALVGGPLIGTIGQHAGPRAALALGGAATVGVAALLLRRQSPVSSRT